MKIKELPQLAGLSIAEKILFLEELWESISLNEAEIAVPQSHKNELDRRCATPGELLTLEELQSRINQKNEIHD